MVPGVGGGRHGTRRSQWSARTCHRPGCGRYTEQALADAAAGQLRPLIGQRFPLERAADAHAAIEARATVGKTLLDVA